MIGQLDSSQKGWVSGKGRGAVWRDIPWECKQIEPQFLMAISDYTASNKTVRSSKVAYMRVSSSTNSRSTIATYLGQKPAGDSVFYFVPKDKDLRISTILSAVFSTFAFDAVVRVRLGGLNMSEFVMVEAVLPTKNPSCTKAVLELATALTMVSPVSAVEQTSMTPYADRSTPARSPRDTESNAIQHWMRL